MWKKNLRIALNSFAEYSIGFGNKFHIISKVRKEDGLATITAEITDNYLVDFVNEKTKYNMER